MFSLFRNIFSKSEGREGLLHGAEEGVLIALRQCVEETESGQRWRVVDTMVELLTAGDRATGVWGVADTADRARSVGGSSYGYGIRNEEKQILYWRQRAVSAGGLWYQLWI